jgi:hypothetical protein
MKFLKHILFVAMLLFLFAGCKKDRLSNLNCNKLKAGLFANDKAIVSSSLTSLLGVYSKENLETLVVGISNDCDISAKSLCFDCIYTLPSQSEIQLTFNQSGNSISKVLDISYTQDNKMKIVGIHN